MNIMLKHIYMYKDITANTLITLVFHHTKSVLLTKKKKRFNVFISLGCNSGPTKPQRATAPTKDPTSLGSTSGESGESRIVSSDLTPFFLDLFFYFFC